MKKKLIPFVLLTLMFVQTAVAPSLASNSKFKYFDKEIKTELDKIYSSPNFVYGTQIKIHYTMNSKGKVTGYKIVQHQSEALKQKVQSANSVVRKFYLERIQKQFPPTEPDWRFKREMEIIRYMLENIDYAIDRYNTDTISDDDATAYGALVKKEAVCQGYAHTFYLLATRCGLEAHIVSNGDHAWNIIKLDDGNYYHVDVTWEDPYESDTGRPNKEYGYKKLRNRYINLTSEEIRMRDERGFHKTWTPNKFECNSLTYGPDKVESYIKELTGTSTDMR
ncbi:transglutaminase domain-containing protein [Filifactor villosus]|uniref:Transglutaminase domain-containing protein n=1 Tax=Filifactor villosus TaxID=29374 RepID=A0ABV9QHY9_9FIRM